MTVGTIPPFVWLGLTAPAQRTSITETSCMTRAWAGVQQTGVFACDHRAAAINTQWFCGKKQASVGQFKSCPARRETVIGVVSKLSRCCR